jgi:Zn-dependent peptidase ImmA (M78 family)
LFRRKSKQDALAYLVEKCENGKINVCQGVLTNKILPHLKTSRSVYKNTSGFVIHDDAVPFVFIPSEVNPDEREGRQIFTLAFPIALIGLDAYEYQIEPDFKVSLLAARGMQSRAYSIASEFLLPYEDTAVLQGNQITTATRDELAQKYKITPTAVTVILRKRGLVSGVEYEALLPSSTLPPAKSVARTPSIELSVRKFNGRYAFELINADFAQRKISAMQIQYLLFGAPNKRGFKKYKSQLGL